MTAADFARWMQYPGTAAGAALLFRLVWISGPRKYNFFLAYLLTDILETLGVWGASTYSPRYAYVYFAGSAVKSILGIGAAMQLWLLTLRDYPGLARFGRRIAIYLLLGALLIAAGGLLLEPRRSATDQSLFMNSFNSMDGAVDSMTVVFLIAATLFLLWFPVRTPRNAAYLMAGFVFYLTEHWAILLLLNLYPSRSGALSVAMEALDSFCLIFWLIVLKAQGETVTTVTGGRWNQSDAEHLLAQLQSINARLERVAH